jgi:hypothetical protein
MILPSWMKIRVAFLPLVKLLGDRVDVFAARGSVMYSLLFSFGDRRFLF